MTAICPADLIALVGKGRARDAGAQPLEAETLALPSELSPPVPTAPTEQVVPHPSAEADGVPAPSTMPTATTHTVTTITRRMSGSSRLTRTAIHKPGRTVRDGQVQDFHPGVDPFD